MKISGMTRLLRDVFAIKIGRDTGDPHDIANLAK